MENTAPKWVTVTGMILILWNAMGVFMFASSMMMTDADMAALPQDQRLLWSQMPTWGLIGFGVGTVGGLLAAIGIALKRKWAATLAVVSILGIIANFTPTFALSQGVDVWQPKFYVFPLLIFIVSLFQLWLARKANSNRWTS